MKRAEILVHLGKTDDAEKIYRKADRRFAKKTSIAN